ncbi:S8 family serine peptidase [Nocardioides limicola]|uniref:S8 family serine peptidase n=1 Tax=Nocardioides limicola TaxID=2803368 RepID=UPI00193BC29F|nr:S8 family serine peptidase [Nocardioides sp. DJM-14]
MSKHSSSAARTRRLVAGLAGAALIAGTFAATGAATADPSGGDYLGSRGSDRPDQMTPESHSGWFVQLTGEPRVKGGRPAALNRQHNRFEASADELGVEMTIKHEYRRLWNGVSAEMSPGDAARVAALPDVAAVFPVLTFDAPDPGSLDVPAMSSALAMTGADIAQSELGLTGAGLKVAVLDTGVDYDHPDFGGTGVNGGTPFPTERVVAGWDFVGDDFNADSSSPAYQPVPNPNDNPDDCQGHGTHVAGIIGADGDVRGVAPGVEFGAYRVFGCAGSTTADIIVAALERAHADGMDVVNMSIGAAFATWPEYPTAAASDALVGDGVTVVASIGNSGASGTWSAGAPGVGDSVIGVASFDNVAYDADVFTVSPDDTPIAYSAGSGAPAAPTEGTLPMLATGTPASPNDGCFDAPALGDLTGSAALIQRGSCFFYDKARNAELAGAEAVVIYNNVAGGFSPSLAPPTADDPPIGIPVVAITHADGVFLHERITDDGTELTWTDETITVENPTGGLISAFSSFGLTADLKVKPDLGAPGGQILSTYPLEQGGQAVASGTSMSAPHVAGAVALLLEARPGTDPETVRDLLQNHSVPADLSFVTGAGLLEPVHRQGAGMISIDRSITADTMVSPGKLSLGESQAGPAVRTLTLTNSGDEEVTYALSNTAAVSTAGVPSDPGYFVGGSTADFGGDEVTVPAGGSADVTVTITAPASPALGLYGGYLEFTPEDGEPLRVPYAGFVGDYQEVGVLTQGAFEFPYLGSLTECDRLIGVDCTMGGSWDVHPEGGASYSMADGDFPTLLVHLEHPARSLTVTLHEALADGSIGDAVGGRNNTVLHVDYLGRSGSASAFTPFVWDGTRQKSQGKGPKAQGTQRVPNGDYVLKVTVLKALGNPGNADHVETWVSPAFTVDRAG